MTVALNTSGNFTLTAAGAAVNVDVTGAGTFLCYLDTNTMAAADRIVARVFVKADGTNFRQLYEHVYANAQDDPAKVSLPISHDLSVRFQLEQTHGTSRTIPYRIEAL